MTAATDGRAAADSPAPRAEAARKGYAMKSPSILLAAVTLAVGSIIQADAHSWYQSDCCSDRDCAPVEEMVWVVPAGGGAPRLVVTTEHGKAIIPHGFPVKESRDGRMHVCMRDHYGEMTVICIFVPPSM